MTSWRFPRSIRVRMTLWHAGALTVVLIGYAGFVLFFVRQQLYAGLDRQLHEDFELAEELLVREPDGSIRWSRSAYHHDEDEPDPSRWVEVWANGGLLVRYPETNLEDSARLPVPGLGPAAGVGSLDLPGDRHVRVLQGSHTVEGTEVLIRAVRSEGRLIRELGILSIVLALGLPLAVLVAATGGFLIARRALHPVGHMTRHARRITADRLEERLPIDSPGDELAQLATTFNEMFSRLERSFEQLRQFTTDASHELRTPLTAIRTVGEVGLREARAPEQYRDVIGSMLEEADHLTRLVDSLLTLSRADSGATALEPERLELNKLARDVAEHLAVLAEEKNQRLEVERAGGFVNVLADHALLRQAVVNLVDNAVKYSPAGSSIRIAVKREESVAILEVSDQGPGIAPQHQERVFDRFYRLDKSRSRWSGGFGLGLSIARLALERQGGRIELESRQGQGSTFRIVLPALNEGEDSALET